MAFTDLIVEFPNVLSKELCDEIILKFEDDERKYDGVTGTGLSFSTKKSTDLHFSAYDEWVDIDTQVYEAFKQPIQDYTQRYFEIVNLEPNGAEFHDTGYQIQKTVPGGFYHWHHDFSSEIVRGLDHRNNVNTYKSAIRTRYYTYIFYLNDRTEYEDGRTQFYHAGEVHSVVPEAGKLLIFPANHLYTHRGEELLNGVKYLMTGWCCTVEGTNYTDLMPGQYEGARNYFSTYYEMI